MDLKKIHSVYFLGIGGIGMSALARYFKDKGVKVSGYDKTPTSLTNKLVNEGMEIHYDDNINKIPIDLDLVIYTPAIPKYLHEFVFLLNSGVTVKKRSEVLGMLTREKRTIAVAGTHGKTTISTLIAHLLKQSGAGCTAFLGGISKNYHSNLLNSENSRWMVVEADEYDRSFLQLQPEFAVITATDADHLDIYGNIGNLKAAYLQFAGNIKTEGTLLIKKGVDLQLNNLKGTRVLQYSLSDGADFYARNVRTHDIGYIFDFISPEYSISDIELRIPGLINVENAVAALSIAIIAGLKESELKAALPLFTGIERRFDIQFRSKDRIYIDDYAHHPEEIRGVVTSVKTMFPGKKITGIFQPHLYSRTRDLADEFARSLELLDEIILLPIYPAREKPIEGVNSDMILKKIAHQAKSVCKKDEVINVISNKDIDVLMTLGAGDIDQLVIPIRDYFIETRSKL